MGRQGRHSLCSAGEASRQHTRFAINDTQVDSMRADEQRSVLRRLHINVGLLSHIAR